MFIFKQKTAYEMSISDWSSDVCSSDLLLAPHDAMNARCLADYVAHPHPGIERGEGILKDHLHLQRAVGRRGPLQRGNRRSTIMDGALRRLQDAGDDPAERRLSTARLADQTNDLAFGDGEEIGRAHV